MSESIIERMLQEDVCELILNRPQKLNALNTELISSLSQKLSRIVQQSTVRVVILSARGKWFCAGADLNWMSVDSQRDEQNNQVNQDESLQLANLFQQLNSLPMVTIAKVSGGAMGGGIGLLCCCDMVIASDDCKFSFSELKLGLLPATIMPYVLAAIGARQARRFMLSAESFSSQTAKDIGLIHQIVTQQQLENEVAQQVQNVLRTAPKTLQQCKALIQKSGFADNKELINESARTLALARSSAEANEGIKAFFSKLQPSWVRSFRGTAKKDS